MLILLFLTLKTYLLFQNPLKRHNVTEILDHEFLKLHEIKPAVSENVSRSANGSIIRNESISSIVSPDSKSGSEESSVDPTDRRGSSDISTVDLNESRAPRGSTALSSNSKWRPRSSSSSDRGDLNTLCSDSSSSTSASSALSCSSPAKSIATSGTTVVSEYRASSTGPSKVAQGRNRLGTSPGVEKEFVGRNLSAGSLAARCHDHSGKLTGNYVWDRNGHRRREDAKDLVIKSSGSKREALRGPTLSAEPEMSLQPPTVLPLAPPTAPSSSSGHSPASAARLGMSKSSSTLESSSISSGFDRHQQHNASRCSGDTGIAPTSWLRAIRSIRQSVGDSTGVTSSEAGASSSHSHRSPLSYAMRIDVGGSTGSLRGVLSVAGQIGGSHGRSSGKGLSDGSHHRPHQFQNRPDLPQQHGWTEQCTDSYGRSAARNTLSLLPQQADTTQPYGPRDSLSKSISIENCTMNGPNWFGESSSSASARPPLKQFCFVCPHTAVLVLNEEGMAMYCGIIKDKAGRSLPCRLYSSSRTPNVVTLGKLDEGMLEELKTIWTAQNHGHFSDSDSDSDGESDIESVDEDFFESHRRVLNDSTSSISSEAKTVQASVAKKEASQYSEFESFYNYESDEDEKMEDTSAEDAKKVSEVSQPAVKRRGKSQKKETSSAAMLHAVRGLRLFSDELLLRSYSVSVATSSFSSSSSTRDDCSMDSTRTSMDRRLSLLPPLPAALTALYSKAAEVFEGVRRRVPRIIMYVPAADVAPSVDPATGTHPQCACLPSRRMCEWSIT